MQSKHSKTNARIVTIVAAMTCLSPAAWSQPKVDDVVKTYADIAHATFQDSQNAAKALQTSILKLIKNPTKENLKAARGAWRSARIPYSQSEAFRFGNKIVDDWEGAVNSWPLDEGLIDYVNADSYGAQNPENNYYTSNIIANPSLKINGKPIDTTEITKSLLRDTLQEAGGVEANVATGYHAIEFLLWGQDLNGTGPGAGNRPATDFDPKNCTGGNCERRSQYLRVATELLVDELTDMVNQWSANGQARKAIATADGNEAIASIFTGIGSLSYGELAGERIKLGLILHDPEETHDCFSDNTHDSHFYGITGIQNVYLGSYTRTDGSKVSGPSVSDLVKDKSQETDGSIRKALSITYQSALALKERAQSTERYDQMIAQGNKEGNAVVMAVSNNLVAQTKEFERALSTLGLDAINFEGSDSLDDPGQIGNH